MMKLITYLTFFATLLVACCCCTAAANAADEQLVPVVTVEEQEFRHENLEQSILEGGDAGDDLACVSFLKYSDNHCLEGPTRKITFTTRTSKGSPCVHDDKQPHISVKDQYCDIASEVFKETEYIGSSKCHVKWYQHLTSPVKFKFTHDTCVGGYQLRYCVQGACPGPGDDEEEQYTDESNTLDSTSNSNNENDNPVKTVA